MSKGPGRPKNPRIKALENKVAKLEKVISELENTETPVIGDGQLNHIGIGCSKKNGKYMLKLIKYNPKTKAAKVTEERLGGDAEHQALFLIRKFLAYEFTFNEEES